MTNIDTITKEQFLAACNNHKPNKFTEFMFDNLSKGATKKWLKNLLLTVFLLGNCIALYMDLNRLSPSLKLTFLFIANGFLLLVVGCSFVATFINNYRINRIAKELNISITDYDKLSIKYLG